MSTMKVDSIVSSGGTNTAQINGALAVNTTSLRTELNASGSAPIYACRAWVNFDGAGTVTIRASGNVTSITDNGVGNYTLNFTTALPDANYAAVFGAKDTSTGAEFVSERQSGTRSTSAFQIQCWNFQGVAVDPNGVNVAIFR